MANMSNFIMEGYHSMKKIISAISALFVISLLLCPTTAMAENNNLFEPMQINSGLDITGWEYDDTIGAAIYTPEIGEQEAADGIFDDVLNANTSARSTQLPTTYKDISVQAYTANLEEVSAIGYLYTNYYFHANDEGRIYVGIRTFSNTGRDVKCRIRLYNLTNKTYLDFDSLIFNNTEALGYPFEGSMYFYNLNTSCNYAIGYTSVPVDSNSWDMLHGESHVSHSPLGY